MAFHTRVHESAGRKNDLRSRRIRDFRAAPTKRRAIQELMELRCKPCNTTSFSSLRPASARAWILAHSAVVSNVRKWRND
ncbi:hypothetical protein FIBSPDRAFT_866591 [Athelia psychrophila]|uniref:Uncharacterized protein n=1 Tax=Athelia psychrophila TaxID=1759441 RepID=A0A166ELF4_9AGAM|nr:hypothetical protein FIBSPDRAFT_866591 [Fibularhizoctonia sp. CBS 109695]